MLAFYLPDEPYKARALALLADYAAGVVKLTAPTLTHYEVLNALPRAVCGLKQGQTISHDEAQAILGAFRNLNLEYHSIEGLEGRILEITKKYQRSAYDAAYLALAERLGAVLVTGDERLYNAVRGDFPPVQFIADYIQA